MEITRKRLLQLNQAALRSLSSLVTPTGIYASSATDIFHGLFGRDTATVYEFILEYMRLLFDTVGLENISPQQEKLLIDAIKGFLYIGQFQGTKDDPTTGEERGKAIHEVRHNPDSYRHLTEGMIKKGLKPFYVDQEGVLKNWDTVDATFLRVICFGRTLLLRRDLEGKPISLPLQESLEAVAAEVTTSRFRDSVEWCLANAKRYGFPGFSYNESARSFTNFPNKHWADSHYSLIHEDRAETPYPKKPVEVTVYAWAAFNYAADIYETQDENFSRILRDEAAILKERFNQDETGGGFLMRSEELYYFAEGIDGTGKQIQIVMCNPVMSLWSTYLLDHIMEPLYIHDVITRALMPDMFRPNAGIRTYNRNIKRRDEVLYHRGPDTYWPFVSVAAAIGMEKLGYIQESQQVLEAAVRGVNYFASKDPQDSEYAPFIENFIAEEDKFRPFSTSEQTSCREQAWTASGMLYATEWLLAKKYTTPTASLSSASV